MVTARQAIIDAALEYRFNVVLRAENGPLVQGYEYGPLGGAGINFRRGSIMFDHDAQPEDMLHELSHLILGKISVNDRVSEGFVLMPFEWELARHLTRKMDKRERVKFMKGVQAYQDCTVIGLTQCGLTEYGPGVRRSKWWRCGVERARRLGLLYSDNTPTFLTANWEESGIDMSQIRKWDPTVDDLFT